MSHRSVLVTSSSTRRWYHFVQIDWVAPALLGNESWKLFYSFIHSFVRLPARPLDNIHWKWVLTPFCIICALPFLMRVTIALAYLKETNNEWLKTSSNFNGVWEKASTRMGLPGCMAIEMKILRKLVYSKMSLKPTKALLKVILCS